MRKEIGHSLLELLGVVAILGIVVGLAVPNLTRAKRQYQLQTAAQQFAQIIQAAKIDAVSKNNTRKIVCNTATNTITTSNGTVIELPAGVRFEALPSAMTAPSVIHSATANHAALPQQSDDEKTSVSFPVGGASNLREINFNSKGLPAVDPGVVHWVYLANEDGQRMAVTLSSVGSASVLSWQGVQWK